MPALIRTEWSSEPRGKEIDLIPNPRRFLIVILFGGLITRYVDCGPEGAIIRTLFDNQRH